MIQVHDGEKCMVTVTSDGFSICSEISLFEVLMASLYTPTRLGDANQVVIASS